MLLSEQVRAYFPDLSNPLVESAIALVHSRFSTNTFPSWHRAHPYRYVTHNGEINTVKGNVNFMHARQTLFRTDVFGPDLGRLFPIVDEDGSDTAMLDNTLEFLTLAGRSLPHVVMMMIPEPWEKHEQMSAEKRAFYAYHSTLMEPWDGPASMAFTDGTVIGATLDRNGLRPSRYYVTTDDRVIMASEVGVLDISPEKVLYKGRLQPGRMFLVDTAAGRIIDDAELKREMAAEHPYGDWLERHMRSLTELPPATQELVPDHETVVQRQQAFGYTFEDLRLILAPMAKDGVEPLGSMGDDTPVAVLSARPQLLYNYFRQLFAQVTNPPIDAIREELVTSSTILLGAEGDLLNPQPEDCRRICIPSPLLSNGDLAKLREIREPGFQAMTLPILFPSGEDGTGLEAALEELFAAADTAIAAGHNLLILSDRAVSREQAPIPALLAISGLHQHLIRQGTRSRVSLILESGEPRETHHFACLIGFGAEAINPYLAFETINDLIQNRLVTGIEYDDAVQKYLKASTKGVIKVLSKMGISTVQSYHAAQIFEALGLSRGVVDRYFSGTPTRIEGADLDVIAEEAHERHSAAFPGRPANGHTLAVGGRYQYREGGEYHLFNPSTIHQLQNAVRTGDYQSYLQYAAEVHDRETQLATLRSLLELKFKGAPLPLEEVESVETIMRRFKTGAMSYGSISREAHETLAVAMNRIGGKSNTGEGGEDPGRYIPDENGDSRNSAIKQVASGRFGVTMEYLTQAQEIQIKMAQGAKPGEGGQLPGHKVYPWVAKVRYSTPGVGLISPPPHHDIYSIEDLAQLIYDLKSANPAARINVKLVSEVGVGTIAAGVAKGHADVILISGHDGGTGASPVSSIKHAGLPWELGLAETHQTLVLNDLRSRVRLETDGQLKTGRDVVIAALLGAEEFGFATAPLVAMGCIMMRVCHLDTCPVGIATQNPELRQRFTGKPEEVANFMRFVAREVRELMAALGARTMDELVGRTDLLAVREDIAHRKARQLDLSPLLYRPEVGPEVGRFCTTSQDHGLESSLDQTVLLDLCRPAVERGEPVEATLPIRNIHRTVGTTLGSEIVRRHGADGLPEDTVRLTFQGSAGQSFAAFLPGGLTFTLEGDANDYIGKGLSGGKIIVKPPDGSIFIPEENIIIGNVAFYGATGGEAYIRGAAGERFCVRNSGVTAVVEAIGDHGCEYMTGGRVVVLGSTGRNFAAGMSGGVAYVFVGDGSFYGRCNLDMVDLTAPDETDVRELNNLIWQHAIQTGSTLAWHMLSDWEAIWPQFVKVLPKDYGRMLRALGEAEAKGLTGDEAIMVAFDANRCDLARVGGN
jgi:glutamate synthase domain-containing protein 2/glutamate synthase domain-containing protein 3